VVVPVFNVAPWITECVSSILAQGIQTMEVLIVDDGSTDGTVELLGEFAAADSRVKIIQGAGGGSAASRNLGVSIARGTYLVFADGDDIVPAGAYVNLIRALDESGSDLAVGNFLTFDMKQAKSRQRDLKIYGERRSDLTLEDEPKLLRDRVVWNKLFRRQWWLDHNILFADSIRSNDIFAVTKALALATIEIIPDIVYLYRKRPGPTSMTARRGDLESLRQHMIQERLCVEFLARATSLNVQETYGTVVLEFSLWDHLISLVQRVPAPQENAAEIAALYSDVLWFVDAAGEKVWETLPRPAKWLYRLIKADRLDLVPALPAFGNKVRHAEMAAACTITIHWYLQLRTAVEPDVYDLFARIIREQLYPALLDVAVEQPELFEARAAILVEVQRSLVARARLATDTIKVVDFIAAGKPEKARARAILQRLGGLVVEARPGRTSTELSLRTKRPVPQVVDLRFGDLHTRRPSSPLRRARVSSIGPAAPLTGALAIYKVSPKSLDPVRNWTLHVDVTVNGATFRYRVSDSKPVSARQ
jgi:glycosyltransferase involved in cell wall biosynthesis